jgi:hypothetical protein
MSSFLPEQITLCGMQFAVADNNQRKDRFITFEYRGVPRIRFTFGFFEGEWLFRTEDPEKFPTDLLLEAQEWIAQNFRIEETPWGLKPTRTKHLSVFPTTPPRFRSGISDHSPWATGGCAGDTLGDAY